MAQPGTRKGMLEGGWIASPASSTTSTGEHKDDAFLWCAGHATKDECEVDGASMCVWHANDMMCLPGERSGPGRRWKNYSRKNQRSARTMLALWRLQRDTSIELSALDMIPPMESLFTGEDDEEPINFQLVPRGPSAKWFFEMVLIPESVRLASERNNLTTDLVRSEMPTFMANVALVRIFNETRGASTYMDKVLKHIRSVTTQWQEIVLNVLGLSIRAVGVIISAMLKAVTAAWNAVVNAVSATFDMIVKALGTIVDIARKAWNSLLTAAGIKAKPNPEAAAAASGEAKDAPTAPKQDNSGVGSGESKTGDV